LKGRLTPRFRTFQACPKDLPASLWQAECAAFATGARPRSPASSGMGRRVGLKRRTCSFAINSASPCGVRPRVFDRAAVTAPCWSGMTRLWPSLLGAAQIVQPETILRWRRAGFTAFWRWKSRKRAGRPQIVIHVFCIMRRMEKCATQRLARQQGAGFRSLKDGQHIEQVACPIKRIKNVARRNTIDSRGAVLLVRLYVQHMVLAPSDRLSVSTQVR
jgi:hypothetical protein